MFQGFIEDIYFFDFLQLANLKTIIKHYRDEKPFLSSLKTQLITCSSLYINEIITTNDIII